MDLSKLPGTKKDDTAPSPAPAPVRAPEEPAPPARRMSAPLEVGADSWISVIVGILVLMLHMNFLKWLFGGQAPTVWAPALGKSITYGESLFFIHDLGLVLFGSALVLDGLVLLTGRRGLILLGLALTAVATLANIVIVAWLYQQGMGIQIYPALAVAIGGYLVMIRLARIRGTENG